MGSLYPPEESVAMLGRPAEEIGEARGDLRRAEHRPDTHRRHGIEPAALKQGE